MIIFNKVTIWLGIAINTYCFKSSNVKKLLWVFTDGDLRRCIESGIRLTTKIKNIQYSNPLTIESGSKVSIALKKMQSNKISILPVVDTMGILLGSVKLSQCI